MNPMVKAMIGGVVRVLVPWLLAKGISIDNERLEDAIDGAAVAFAVAWSIYQKFRVDRKLKKVAATGVL
jgi:hypothetical protein